jgi:transcriptional regulator with XRE-family HTH domain
MNRTHTPTRLRAICRERGYSMRRLADELEVTRETVRTWADGENHPQRRNARALQAIFGMPVEALLAPDPGTTATAAQERDGR